MSPLLGLFVQRMFSALESSKRAYPLKLVEQLMCTYVVFYHNHTGLIHPIIFYYSI